ncbi:hypothetical protein M9458_040365, partial [Cirrhinus mrigala]
FAAFLLDKLQTLEWPPRGSVCGTPLHHLRRLALHSALGLAFDDMPDLQPGPLSGLLPPRVASHSSISPSASWEWPTKKCRKWVGIKMEQREWVANEPVWPLSLHFLYIHNTTWRECGV